MKRIMPLCIFLCWIAKIQASSVDDLVRATSEYYADQTKADRDNIRIISIDDLAHTITLSNGMELSYLAAGDQSVAHWLKGQLVCLQIGRKRGTTKLVNLETGEWIEVAEG